AGVYGQTQWAYCLQLAERLVNVLHREYGLRCHDELPAVSAAFSGCCRRFRNDRNKPTKPPGAYSTTPQVTIPITMIYAVLAPQLIHIIRLIRNSTIAAMI